MLKSSLSFIILVAMTASGMAEIIVEVQNASIAAGGTGFVDVWISSTSSDDLYSSGYEFEITATGPNGISNGSLQFRADIDQSNSEQVDAGPPDYVFFGDTDPGNFSATRQDPDTTRIVGGDIKSTAINATLDTTQRLLARLEIEHLTGTPLAAVNDTFSIMLKNSLFTEFQSVNNQGTVGDLSDDTYASLTIDAVSYANVGTITITSAAVPEPGSCVALSIASAAVVACQRRRAARRHMAMKTCRS
ncbi:MAG: hypothetical protein U0936_16560 [Planctomycetaceae bacterium]